ncbi:MAG: hypothetical protein GXW99_10910 [Clostridiales bacterium]|nr:hypothetical protein [Clostridiales bacterium]
MFYSLQGGVRPVDIADWDGQTLTAGCITPEEWKELGASMGFSASAVQQYEEETHHFHTRVENYETYSIASFHLPESRDGKDHERNLALYLRENLFVLVEPGGKGVNLHPHFEGILRRVPINNANMERLLHAIFNELLDRCDAALETLEQQIEALSDMVMSETTEKKFTQKLMRVKRQLLKRHTFCDTVIELEEKLQTSENGILPTEGDLRFLRFLAERATRQLHDIDTLREEAAQIWEAYQSMTDLRLNGIMKVFTVVSAIFLPLTLITGWYGMNFTGMSELDWQYGYPAVAILCVVVVLVCIWIFKKKHWM